MMSKSILEGSGHIPSPPDPVSAQDIRKICAYIDSIPRPHPAFKAAVLLAFATFLRVSNVLSPSRFSWGGAHKVTHQGLTVVIRSTKTRRHSEPPILLVLRVEEAPMCPVLAWERYFQAIQPCPLGPAFMLDDNTPLTHGPVVSLMRTALTQSGKDPSAKVSFHSLRRGGAQTAANNGATQDQIMCHRTWKSVSGVQAYLKSDSCMVPAIIARTLAK